MSASWKGLMRASLSPRHSQRCKQTLHWRDRSGASRTRREGSSVTGNSSPLRGASLYTITFYSAKGGVGRTLALVNVALALERLKKRVLLVDFDLNSAGLETI